MNDYLLNNTKDIDIEGLSLWFGITGQKRSWLEQVDGCVSLVKEVLKYYTSLTLIIDGWTAYDGDALYTQEDHNVFKKYRIKLIILKGLN